MSTLDQVMNYLADSVTINRVTITPTKGTSYANWGGCSYHTYGKLVILMMGLSGLTANTTNTVYRMPDGLRPSRTINAMGGAQNTSTYSTWNVASNGNVGVWTPNTYANATIVYIAAD